MESKVLTIKPFDMNPLFLPAMGEYAKERLGIDRFEIRKPEYNYVNGFITDLDNLAFLELIAGETDRVLPATKFIYKWYEDEPARDGELKLGVLPYLLLNHDGRPTQGYAIEKKKTAVISTHGLGYESVKTSEIISCEKHSSMKRR